MKSIFYLGLLNILIIIALTIFLKITGLDQMMNQSGLGYEGLFFFCLFWGMGGSFISLLLSKWMAKSMMGVKLIDTQGPYSSIVETVYKLAKKAGLHTMPEVGIYESEDLNAFATGPSKSNSLVAVTTGLVNKMTQDELEGVLGHEIAHIANGDMVTMTLMQGVLNAFVMFAARIVSTIIVQALANNKDDDRPTSSSGLGYFANYIIIVVLEMVFGLFASILLAWFSRHREFRADNGGAYLSSKNKMIAALSALEKNYEQIPESDKSVMKNMKISSREGFMALFSTHPPLRKRIEALKNGVNNATRI